MLPVRNDTLLRAVRRHGSPQFVAPTVIGIDDWAWRRNQRYGTIICDLERRKTIALLPDRDPATAQGWLSDQRQIKVVARDRGGGYAVAVTRALPQGDPGRRSVASDGERQPRFSRCCAQIHAADP
jgi:transposase